MKRLCIAFCLVVACMIFVLSACRNMYTKVTPIEYIDEMVKDEIAVKCSDDTIIHTEMLPRNFPKTYFLYVINASCSACVYSFVSFYKHKELACETPVCVVVDEDYLPNLEFYVGKAGIDIDNKKLFILPNTKTIISKNIEEEDLSGHVFLVANGVKIKHVYYKGAAVVFE